MKRDKYRTRLAEHSNEDVSVESRLEIVERHVDWLFFDQLEMKAQLWVQAMQVMLTVFGACIIVTLAAGALGIQPWETIIAYLALVYPQIDFGILS